jgi:hypothetical protein
VLYFTDVYGVKIVVNDNNFFVMYFMERKAGTLYTLLMQHLFSETKYGVLHAEFWGVAMVRILSQWFARLLHPELDLSLSPYRLLIF